MNDMDESLIHIHLYEWLSIDDHPHERHGWVTHPYQWHGWPDTFVCDVGLLHVSDMTHACVSDMTHACVWRDSSTSVPWLIHMCAMTHAYVWRDASICAPWLMHMCAMTHSDAWHAIPDPCSLAHSRTRSSAAVVLGARLNESTMRMSHGTHMNESWHTYEWVMSHTWMNHGTQ